jgi:hypothetical protein
VELGETEISFDGFIDDLANAAMRCSSVARAQNPEPNPEPGTASAKRELRTLNLEPGTLNLEPRRAAPRERSEQIRCLMF